MPTIGVYSLSDFNLVSGPDPWPTGSNAEGSAPGATLIQLDPGASVIQVEITDNDAVFDDADNSQDLAAPATVNGTNYSAGQNFENEYSYVIRPQGSTDPGEQIVIYAIDEGGSTPTIGVAATSKLTPGQTYEIVSVDQNNPSISYSSLFVCFDTGTRIATPTGQTPVEHLHAGDAVMTMDGGAKRILWTARRELTLTPGNDAHRPILIGPSSLGPDCPRRALRVSPQHRLLVNAPGLSKTTGHAEALAPAKAFVGRRGIRQMKGKKSVCYHTLLLEEHSIIFAEGMPVETLYPTPYALSLLTILQRLSLHAALPGLTREVTESYSMPIRPCVTAGAVRDLPRDRPVYETPSKAPTRRRVARRVAGMGRALPLPSDPS